MQLKMAFQTAMQQQCHKCPIYYNVFEFYIYISFYKLRCGENN